MLKNILKFSGIGIGIVILGLGILYGAQYLRYRTSPEYRAMKYLEDLHKQAVEDPYGGDTPEETLRLFIDALKKGNVDLASKYFTIDEQEKWKGKLNLAKSNGTINKLIEYSNNLGDKYPLIQGNNNRFIFEAYNEKKEFVMQADLVKGPSGKWKISDL